MESRTRFVAMYVNWRHGKERRFDVKKEGMVSDISSETNGQTYLRLSSHWDRFSETL